ncbi:MAG: DEAD/DEAH box helicase [Cytophagales bacterium]|nr:MAG: DEAD/DEAH box helicase [Cytophagales bacterium]
MTNDSSFASLGLSAPLLKAIDLQHYTEAYPIQAEVIPAALAGKDILGIAQTGSGKTASFVLPILELLTKTPAAKSRYIKALVLVPTRELAAQVGEVFQQLGSKLPQKIKTLAVFGGVSINPQMMALHGVEILIATPGRLLDLIDSKAVHLSEVKILVLDEADKMLNLGFKEEMTKLFALLPAKRQNMLFSATLGKEIDSITEFLLQNPVRIEIKGETFSIDSIDQSAYLVAEERKSPLLRYLIKKQEMKQVLVFTSSVHKADSVVKKLNANGIQAVALHSEKSQGARTEALRSFKAGKLRVLVATDLASRGIDIQSLPFVINYELPRSPKDYIHRIGRTGRAASVGIAISLISPASEHHFKVIQKKMGKQIVMHQTDDLDLKGF